MKIPIDKTKADEVYLALEVDMIRLFDTLSDLEGDFWPHPVELAGSGIRVGEAVDGLVMEGFVRVRIPKDYGDITPGRSQLRDFIEGACDTLDELIKPSVPEHLQQCLPDFVERLEGWLAEAKEVMDG